MHARIEQIELEALQAQVRLANELEEVRRSFRARAHRALSRRPRAGARRRRPLTVSTPPQEVLEMQPDRFTIKSQEALAAAARLAQQRAQPAGTSRAPAERAARRRRLVRRRSCRSGRPAAQRRPPRRRRAAGAHQARRRAARAARRGRRALDELPRLSAARRRPRPCPPASSARSSRPPRARRRRSPTSTSPPSTCCSRCQPMHGRAGAALRAVGASRERLLQALAEVRGSHRVTDQAPEEKLRSARALRHATSPRRPSRASSTR